MFLHRTPAKVSVDLRLYGAIAKIIYVMYLIYLLPKILSAHANAMFLTI